MADQAAQSPEAAGPQWVTDDRGVTATTAPRHMKFVRLTVDELDDFKSLDSSIDLALCGMSFGAFLTVGITLWTVTLPTPTAHILFVLMTIIFAVASAYFGINTVRCEIKRRKKIDRLKKMAEG
jgi:hypothetical protein